MNKRNGLFVITVMTLSLAFSTVFAFAGTQTVNSYSATFKATSATTATADVYAESSVDTPYITSKITLQSAAKGSSSYQNVSGVNPNTKTVNGRTISHKCEFAISDSKDYRIKIELTDNVSGTIITKTYYQNLSR